MTRKASVDFIKSIFQTVLSLYDLQYFNMVCVSVCVFSKAKTYGLDDGDVYMSSYENRFRLFSTVEHEGQLYMTPLNFIESISLNEPKSECTRTTWLLPTILNILWRKEGIIIDV